MCKSITIAKYLIDFQTKEANLNISHLKLQKLLFYTQAFHLAYTDEELFEEEIQAWEYGPVQPEVYETYKNYGNAIIPPEEKDEESGDILKTHISENSYGVISSVLNAFAHISGIGLMEKTHREDPWKDAYAEGSKTVIKKEIMQAYYKSFLNT